MRKKKCYRCSKEEDFNGYHLYSIVLDEEPYYGKVYLCGSCVFELGAKYTKAFFDFINSDPEPEPVIAHRTKQGDKYVAEIKLLKDCDIEKYAMMNPHDLKKRIITNPDTGERHEVWVVE